METRREPHPSRRPVAAADPDTGDTPTRILDAAETLFVEKGFDASSMRAIATRAGVNLAAAHYHFGSKDALLGAVIHRRAGPINERRLRALDALEADGRVPSARELLEAFLDPVAAESAELAHIIARVYGEPASRSQPLIAREFGPTGERFLAALSRALPELSQAELRWRFHFTIGAMLHMLTFPSPPPFHLEIDDRDRVRHLLEYAHAGITRGVGQPAASSAEHRAADHGDPT